MPMILLLPSRALRKMRSLFCVASANGLLTSKRRALPNFSPIMEKQAGYRYFLDLSQMTLGSFQFTISMEKPLYSYGEASSHVEHRKAFIMLNRLLVRLDKELIRVSSGMSYYTR